MRVPYYDNFGVLIGYTELAGSRLLVFDANGKYKGKVQDGKTFDDNGVLISMSEIPGFLFKSLKELPRVISIPDDSIYPY